MIREFFFFDRLCVILGLHVDLWPDCITYRLSPACENGILVDWSVTVYLPLARLQYFRHSPSQSTFFQKIPRYGFERLGFQCQRIIFRSDLFLSRFYILFIQLVKNGFIPAGTNSKKPIGSVQVQSSKLFNESAKLIESSIWPIVQHLLLASKRQSVCRCPQYSQEARDKLCSVYRTSPQKTFPLLSRPIPLDGQSLYHMADVSEETSLSTNEMPKASRRQVSRIKEDILTL